MPNLTPIATLPEISNICRLGFSIHNAVRDLRASKKEPACGPAQGICIHGVYHNLKFITKYPEQGVLYQLEVSQQHVSPNIFTRHVSQV